MDLKVNNRADCLKLEYTETIVALFFVSVCLLVGIKQIRGM